MRVLFIALGVVALIGGFLLLQKSKPLVQPGIVTSVSTPAASPQPTILPANYKKPVTTYIIPQQKHTFQTFNNCGPATLSMALSYNGLDISQQEIGSKLRPYQNPQGDNDDKSVFFPEMSKAAESYGLKSYMRPNGTIELLKTFISNDIPVVVRTWLHKNEDIGHYRLIRGYDESTDQIIQDDSYEGKNLRYSYQDFNELWQAFGYDYLIVVSKDKQALVEAILKDELDEKVAWQNAQKRAEKEQNLFNLSVSSFYLGEYQKSVEAFEKTQSSLPPRMLWYQTEPIQAYLALKNYPKVLQMTEQILKNDNLAYSELYVFRGQSYKEQGQKELARQEFEKAVLYNKNFEQFALTSGL